MDDRSTSAEEGKGDVVKCPAAVTARSGKGTERGVKQDGAMSVLPCVSTRDEREESLQGFYVRQIERIERRCIGVTCLSVGCAGDILGENSLGV